MQPRVVFLVSDRDDWVDQAIDACRAVEVAPERYTWSTAADLPGVGNALVADIDGPISQRQAAVEGWARQAWQPICVVSLVTDPGMSALYQEFHALGYRRLIPANGLPTYWRCIRENVRGVVDGSSWLVPVIAERYGCHEPEIISALAVAVDLANEVRTVQGLTRAMGIPDPAKLRQLFAQCDCPAPKEIPQRIRLALAIDFARTTEPRPTRDTVAEKLGYSSGAFLGRHTNRLTGSSFGVLVEAGPLAAFLMARP